MVREKEIFWKNILQGIDGLVIVIAFFTSFFLMGYIREAYQLGEMAYAPSFDVSGALFFFRNNTLIFFSAIVLWLVFLSFFKVYEDFRTRSFKEIAKGVIKSGFFVTLALGSVIFLSKLVLTSRLYVATFSSVAMVFLIIEKRIIIYIFELLHQRGLNTMNILIVGSGKRAQKFIQAVKRHSKWGLNVIGLVDDEASKVNTNIMDYKVLGTLNDIPSLLHKFVIDRVVFVVPRKWLGRIEEAILACESEGVGAYLSLDLYNTRISRVKQTWFADVPLLEFKTFSAKEWQLFVKRILDIGIASVGLLISAPLFLLIAIGIKLSSKGPVLFKQKRCGINGRQFTLYKFRTMIVGAEIRKRELERQNEMKGPVFKLKRDPRVFPFGRILRKTSLDELPQLINVLKGDMSIVGPRPPLPVEVEMYEIWQRRRLSLKPGITCIWQVSGRNMVDFDEWMEMDLKYIDNWSLWLDLKIIFKTFFVVLFGYGAY
ncbi:sugar transferase [candidate division KSB1 bacterium]|nr:MAG: sugar transferase [candidate division KSB1 bacterium]